MPDRPACAIAVIHLLIESADECIIGTMSSVLKQL